MWKRLGLVALVAATMALAFTACGGEEGDDTCTTDTDCAGENQICHPNAKVCVVTCTSSADCPESEKTCEAIGGGNNTMICKCATDALCQAGPLGSTAICHPTHEVCVVDGGGATCSATSTTIGTNGGQDTCNYGDVCSGGSCAAAPVGTCGEATGSGAPTWNKTAKAAPVIMSATAVVKNPTSSTSECAGGDPAGIVTIKYYAPNGLTTHTDFQDLQNHVRFRTLTSGQFFGANFGVQDPPTSGQFGELKVGIGCGNATETAALYIADEAGNTSNVVCVSW